MNKINTVTIIVALLALLTPASEALSFNGAPLLWLEMLFLVVVVTPLCIPDLIFSRLRRIIMLVVLGLLVGVKLLSLYTVPYGWSVCLQRVIETRETLTTPCEASLGNASGSETIRTADIQYEANTLPLYFLNNSKAFNFHKEDEPDRKSLPYRLRASGVLISGWEDTVTFQSSLRDVAIRLNNERLELINGAATVALSKSQKYYVEIEYQALYNPVGALTIDTGALVFPEAGLISSRTTVYTFRVIYYALLVGIAGIAIGIWARIVRSMPRRVTNILWTIGTIYLAAGLLFGVSYVYFLAGALIAILFYAISSRSVRPFLLVVSLILAMLQVSTIMTPDSMTILEGGDDPLTHESHARQVFTGNTWRDRLAAGEPYVFYYQPLYRYVLAIEHMLTGESLWGPFVLQTWLFIAALMYVGRYVYETGKGIGLGVYVVGILLTEIIAEHRFITLAATTYQESVAIPFLLISFTMLMRTLYSTRISLPYLFTSGLLMGAALMTRIDLLPAVLVAIALITLRTYQRVHETYTLHHLGIWLLGFIVFPLGVAARNMYIAGQAAVLTSSGYVNLSPQLVSLSGSPAGDQSLLWYVLQAIISHPLGFVTLLFRGVVAQIQGPSVALTIAGVFALGTLFLGAISRRNNQHIHTRVWFCAILGLLLLGALFIQDNGLAHAVQYQLLFVIGLSVGLSILFDPLLEKVQRYLQKF